MSFCHRYRKRCNVCDHAITRQQDASWVQDLGPSDEVERVNHNGMFDLLEKSVKQIITYLGKHAFLLYLLGPP